jgi:1-pyrroline-5-carboxylate dehydrogenase
MAKKKKAKVGKKVKTKTMKKGKVKKAAAFRLTYATMFKPPKELHSNYEKALGKVMRNLGQDIPMLIDGQDVRARSKFKDTSPTNQELILGIFQKGTATHANHAIAAARGAFRDWSRRSYKDRVQLLRKAAAQIDKRIYEIAAVISLEVGKNRMEALGDIAEAADLIRYACDQMELNKGFRVKMGRDPLKGYRASNTSVLRPYGVWLVISPFNFPAALTGGPVGAALVAGNTVVMKPATDTPWTVRLLAECFHDAGIPDGVVNYVTGPGSSLGQALIDSADVDGVTFTGSYDVGMSIYRSYAKGAYPRPIILEMGGKNPTIVSKNADLDRAVAGVVRSAFGLQGQKCSANSRIYVEKAVYQEFVSKLVELTEKIEVGDPTIRSVFMGPVINKNAYSDFKDFCAQLEKAGTLLTGGQVLTVDEYSKGFFCQPTIAIEVPHTHPLWKQEMFLPITMIHPINNLEQGMTLANDVMYGLTSGFYGTEEEAAWFFENIEAGVNYANRPQGATTGAWPGFQPFGGWKGSGSSGKNAGGHYYVQLYMHEQIRTIIR